MADALFQTGRGLEAFVVDIASGNVTSRNKVSGPVADYISIFYGESTRIWPYDAETRKFVWADADMVTPGTGAGKLSLYTVDATTGASTATAVSGECCPGYPLGLAWDAGAAELVLGSHSDDKTACFCAVDGKGALMKCN